MSVCPSPIKNGADAGRCISTLRASRQPPVNASSLAQQAHISRDTLYRLLKGEDVSLATLLALLRTLGYELQAIPAQPPTLDQASQYFGL